MMQNTDQGTTPAPEAYVVKSRQVVRFKDGRTVRRTAYTNGTIQEDMVFPGDYPDVPLVEE